MHLGPISSTIDLCSILHSFNDRELDLRESTVYGTPTLQGPAIKSGNQKSSSGLGISFACFLIPRLSPKKGYLPMYFGSQKSFSPAIHDNGSNRRYLGAFSAHHGQSVAWTAFVHISGAISGLDFFQSLRYWFGIVSPRFSFCNHSQPCF